ncbi:MAG: beta strand repeat-containing protein, partial [Planctomycetia bacterium]
VTSGTLTSGTFLASSGTVSAALAGTGSLVKDGSGTVVLSGTNSYTGGTTINGGLVQVGSADALGSTGTISFGGGGIAYTANNTTDYSGRFSTDTGQLYNVNMNGQTATWATSLTSGSTSSLTRAGTGLLTLTGTATGIGSGGITINGGTTVIDPGEVGTFASTGRVRIGNSSGAATMTMQSGSINLTPATDVYIGLADNATGTSTLNVAGGVVTLGLANTRLMVGNKGPATINVTGGLLQITGGNPIYIGGDSSFTQNNANGTLTVASGTVSIPSAGTFSIGNSGTAGNTFTGVAGTLNLNGGELQTARAITTSTLGSSPATSTVNFNGGLLTPLASSATFLQGLTTANVQNGGALVNTNGFDITIAQNMLGAGTGGLTKSGSGTLTLSGSNTFTGDTLVSAGTLALGSAAALSQSVFDTAGAGMLSFGSLTAVSLGGIKGSGNAVLSNTASAAVALTVGGSASSSLYSGTFSGAGSLTKVGSGTFTLTGSHSYSGGTTISAGALQIGNGGTTGAVTGPIENNGTLIFNRQNTTTYSGTISGSGLVVHSGSAQLTLSASNSYTGGTLITGTGSLQITNAAQVGSGTIALRTAANSTGTVLSLINGVTITNPIVLDQTASNRNNITVSGGAVTLSGPITITGTGSGVNVFFNSVAGASLAITGNITAPSTYTGALSFRNQTISISGTVNMPAAGFDLNSGGTTILSSTGNVWSYTQFQASANVLRLGADNAIPTTASLSISSNSTGGGIDLNGFNQTVPGFTSTSSTTSIPVARIFNSAATDSTLTLAGLTADRSATVALADGTGGGKLALVMNSAGRTQTLASATSSYTGGTTILAGTLAQGAANALGSTSGALAVNGGTLDLRGFGLTVGLLSGSSGGVITSGTAGAVTFTASSASDSTFGGLIQNGLGTVGLTKAGSGALTLTAAHTYTGPTNVNGGRLAVDGSLASAVTVGLGGEIGGSGSVGALGGAGLVGPGNSPGILTAPSVDPSGGLDFAFEFTQATPNYASPTASDNDLLWLTDTVTPFTGSLTGANTVSIYLTQSTAALSELTGGFFTAAAGDFFASISGATFQYFVQDAAGTFSYNGQTYKTLTQYDPSKSISVTTVGANGGQVMQLVVVPEPGAIVLAGVGAAIAALACRRGKMPL